MFGLMTVRSHNEAKDRLLRHLENVASDRDGLEREVGTLLTKLAAAREELARHKAKVDQLQSTLDRRRAQAVENCRKANAKRHAEAEARKASKVPA